MLTSTRISGALTVASVLLLLVSGYLPWMVPASDATRIPDIGSYLFESELASVEILSSYWSAQQISLLTLSHGGGRLRGSYVPPVWDMQFSHTSFSRSSPHLYPRCLNQRWLGQPSPLSRVVSLLPRAYFS